MWLLLLACASDESLPPSTAPGPPAPVETPADPPAGRIGGEPILERPVVIGGIANEAVEEVIHTHADALKACHAAPGAGKLLLHFTLDPAGAVSDARIRSTTLRHPATEDCVLKVLRSVAFPPLERGSKAVVTWPLALP